MAPAPRVHHYHHLFPQTSSPSHPDIDLTCYLSIPINNHPTTLRNPHYHIFQPPNQRPHLPPLLLPLPLHLPQLRLQRTDSRLLLLLARPDARQVLNQILDLAGLDDEVAGELALGGGEGRRGVWV